MSVLWLNEAIGWQLVGNVEVAGQDGVILPRLVSSGVCESQLWIFGAQLGALDQSALRSQVHFNSFEAQAPHALTHNERPLVAVDAPAVVVGVPNEGWESGAIADAAAAGGA